MRHVNLTITSGKLNFMSEGCPGCFTSAKGIQQEYNRIKAEAIKYMREKKVSVAIYKEGFDFFYMQQDKITNEPIMEYLLFNE